MDTAHSAWRYAMVVKRLPKLRQCEQTAQNSMSCHTVRTRVQRRPGSCILPPVQEKELCCKSLMLIIGLELTIRDSHIKL